MKAKIAAILGLTLPIVGFSANAQAGSGCVFEDFRSGGFQWQCSGIGMEDIPYKTEAFNKLTLLCLEAGMQLTSVTKDDYKTVYIFSAPPTACPPRK
jgi:hypothetical protein